MQKHKTLTKKVMLDRLKALLRPLMKSVRSSVGDTSYLVLIIFGSVFIVIVWGVVLYLAYLALDYLYLSEDEAEVRAALVSVEALADRAIEFRNANGGDFDGVSLSGLRSTRRVGGDGKPVVLAPYGEGASVLGIEYGFSSQINCLDAILKAVAIPAITSAECEEGILTFFVE